MKYTTLPTKPGRYSDRNGDEWTLTEDLKWCYCMSSDPASRSTAEDWLPFTDAPTSTDDKVQRIENIKDIKVGDRVYFRNDPNAYKLMNLDRKNYLCVSLRLGGGPAWLCEELPDYMLIDNSFFDHAERPKPSWPEPEGTIPRMYLGADGNRYIYTPCGVVGIASWTYINDGYYAWSDAATLAKKRPEALPLREFTAPEEEK